MVVQTEFSLQALYWDLVQDMFQVSNEWHKPHGDWGQGWEEGILAASDVWRIFISTVKIVSWQGDGFRQEEEKFNTVGKWLAASQGWQVWYVLTRSGTSTQIMIVWVYLVIQKTFKVCKLNCLFMLGRELEATWSGQSELKFSWN